MDARTGFTDHLVHAGGKVTRPAELKRNLLYVIIAEATNMGLGAMAESCGVPYDALAATWLISASRVSATARRVDGRRRGLPTFRAGLSLSPISPSSSACRYRQRSAAMRFSAAPRPPRALQRGTACDRTCLMSCRVAWTTDAP